MGLFKWTFIWFSDCSSAWSFCLFIFQTKLKGRIVVHSILILVVLSTFALQKMLQKRTIS